MKKEMMDLNEFAKLDLRIGKIEKCLRVAETDK
jgi:tRNA-binding EMAP/Myf-like protein